MNRKDQKGTQVKNKETQAKNEAKWRTKSKPSEEGNQNSSEEHNKIKAQMDKNETLVKDKKKLKWWIKSTSSLF